MSAPAQPYYYPFPTEAILSHTDHINDNHRHDVRPVNVSVLSDTASTFVNNTTLESDKLPSHSQSQYDSLNASRTRLRTSPVHPVHRNSSLLAAHHGIPTFLPPPPVPTSRTSSFTAPHSTIADPITYNLSLNYQAMLSSSSSNDSTMPPPASPRGPVEEILENTENMQQLLRHIVELSTSPEFASREFVSPEFGVSPEFTPEMAFDTTPALGYLTSPMAGDPGMMEELQTPLNEADDLSALLSTGFDSFGDAPLFGGCEPMTDESYAPVEKAAPMPHTISPLDSLYTMSPASPFINPSALTSPAMPADSMYVAPQNTRSSSSTSGPVIRKKGPTGTRKNITPSALIPEDAPIQGRIYALPSVTSRKAIPQTFARKRSRSQAFADEEDELEDADMPAPSNAEEAAIQAKRRQNTLAARRSRRRKLEYQMELETALDDQKRETDKWKGRAESLKAILFSMGAQCPPWED